MVGEEADSVMRSRNRRRPSAASIHSRSIAGTSHSTRSTRPSAGLRRGLAVDPDLPRARPVRPRSRPHAAAAGPATAAADLPAQRLGPAGQILGGRPAQARARARAARQLPACWSCPRRSGRRSRRGGRQGQPRRAVAAEMRQRQGRRSPARPSRLPFQNIPGSGAGLAVRPASASRHRPPTCRCLRASASDRRPS